MSAHGTLPLKLYTERGRADTLVVDFWPPGPQNGMNFRGPKPPACAPRAVGTAKAWLLLLVAPFYGDLGDPPRHAGGCWGSRPSFHTHGCSDWDEGVLCAGELGGRSQVPPAGLTQHGQAAGKENSPEEGWQ